MNSISAPACKRSQGIAVLLSALLTLGPAAPGLCASADDYALAQLTGDIRNQNTTFCGHFRAGNWLEADKDSFRLRKARDEGRKKPARIAQTIDYMYGQLKLDEKLTAYGYLTQAITPDAQSQAAAANAKTLERFNRDRKTYIDRAVHALDDLFAADECPRTDVGPIVDNLQGWYKKRIEQPLAAALRAKRDVEEKNRRAHRFIRQEAAKLGVPANATSAPPAPTQPSARRAPDLGVYRTDIVDGELRQCLKITRLCGETTVSQLKRIVEAYDQTWSAEDRRLHPEVRPFVERARHYVRLHQAFLRLVESRSGRFQELGPILRALGPWMGPQFPDPGELYKGYAALAKSLVGSAVNETRAQAVGAILAHGGFLVKVPGVKGRPGGWGVDLRGLAAVRGLERKAAAEQYAAAVLRALGKTGESRRLKPIAALLLDNLGRMNAVAVTADGQMSVMLRGARGFAPAMAAFEQATSLPGTPGGQALVVRSLDGRRVREYLSDGTRLEWWDGRTHQSDGVLPWEASRRSRGVNITHQRRFGSGAEEKSWISVNGRGSTFAIETLKTDIPGSSPMDRWMGTYYQPLVEKLGRVPALGDAVQFLGWVGDFGYAGIVGGFQSAIGGVTNTGYNRLEGLSSVLKAYQAYLGVDLAADFENSLQIDRVGKTLQARVEGTPKIMGVIAALQAEGPEALQELKLKIFQMRAVKLQEAGLTPNRLGGKRFAALQFRPVTNEELAYGLISYFGVGTYGARVSQEYGGVAGGLMSFLEEQGRGLPTLLAFWGLGKLGRLAAVPKTGAALPFEKAVPIVTTSRAGTAAVTATRVASNAAHFPFSHYMTLQWASGIPANMTGVISALGNGNGHEFTQRLAQLTFDVTMTRAGLKEARENRRRLIGDLTTLRDGLLGYLRVNPGEQVYERALSQINAALSRLGSYEDVVGRSRAGNPVPEAPPPPTAPSGTTAQTPPPADSEAAPPAAVVATMPSAAPRAEQPAAARPPSEPALALEPASARNPAAADRRISAADRRAIERRNALLADLKSLKSHQDKIRRLTRYLDELQAENPDGFNDDTIVRTYLLAFGTQLNPGDLLLLKRQMREARVEMGAAPAPETAPRVPAAPPSPTVRAQEDFLSRLREAKARGASRQEQIDLLADHFRQLLALRSGVGEQRVRDGFITFLGFGHPLRGEVEYILAQLHQPAPRTTRTPARPLARIQDSLQATGDWRTARNALNQLLEAHPELQNTAPALDLSLAISAAQAKPRRIELFGRGRTQAPAPTRSAKPAEPSAATSHEVPFSLTGEKGQRRFVLKDGHPAAARPADPAPSRRPAPSRVLTLAREPKPAGDNGTVRTQATEAPAHRLASGRPGAAEKSPRRGSLEAIPDDHAGDKRPGAAADERDFPLPLGKKITFTIGMGPGAATVSITRVSDPAGTKLVIKSPEGTRKVAAGALPRSGIALPGLTLVGFDAESGTVRLKNTSEKPTRVREPGEDLRVPFSIGGRDVPGAAEPQARPPKPPPPASSPADPHRLADFERFLKSRGLDPEKDPSPDAFESYWKQEGFTPDQARAQLDAGYVAKWPSTFRLSGRAKSEAEKVLNRYARTWLESQPAKPLENNRMAPMGLTQKYNFPAGSEVHFFEKSQRVTIKALDDGGVEVVSREGRGRHHPVNGAIEIILKIGDDNKLTTDGYGGVVMTITIANGELSARMSASNPREVHALANPAFPLAEGPGLTGRTFATYPGRDETLLVNPESPPLKQAFQEFLAFAQRRLPRHQDAGKGPAYAQAQLLSDVVKWIHDNVSYDLEHTDSIKAKHLDPVDLGEFFAGPRKAICRQMGALAGYFVEALQVQGLIPKDAQVYLIGGYSHAWAVVKLGSKTYVLDPAQRTQAVQQRDRRHSGSFGGRYMYEISFDARQQDTNHHDPNR
ncbi:MAG: hypothetical protein HY552_07120 [Elusimicrobia bacterium]|nr:hypothetical protein [Elusimicrobiota bacterium]